MSAHEPPYRSLLHYDPTATKEGIVWIGMGTDLAPVCGNRDFISVTDRVELTECGNCLRVLAAEGRSA
ncbi:hypothetical protein GCM10025867_46470 (plasmid) [Frondihabitans sucicola]|uniref:DUF3039 domain-containing protein n=1 Tax=Frondihabitans sucicola TaxID=1268041 RepID=A0ABM8GVD6_9MICO|nr:hypothetical protein [Frondihabitans sucicola]BDZ52406.1 hypothetical protein GCM10025867_46470 [Frondihabitans sucicola]